MQHVLEAVDVKALVAFEADQIVAVAFVVPHEEILAVGRIDVFPICKGFLNGEKRRMIVYLIFNAVGIKPRERAFNLF